MSDLKQKIKRAKNILKTNFGKLDIELMMEYLTDFSKSMAAETNLRRFNTYLLQEGLSHREAQILMVKSFSLEHGSRGSGFWN